MASLSDRPDPLAAVSVPNPETVATGIAADARRTSWVLHVLVLLQRTVSSLFGMASIVFLLAVAANIPILQLLSFGYLLEVSGRLARNQKFSEAMIGLRKASVLGSIALGTWLMLLPIRLVSNFWFEAYLIDPESPQTQFLRVLQMLLIVLVVAHTGAAWLCGGKLRYFFWPIVAPISFVVWLSPSSGGLEIFLWVPHFNNGLVCVRFS